MNEQAQAALQQLTEKQWARLIKQLGRYTMSVSSNKFWRTKNTEELPGGETVDSIVSKAIEKVFLGAFEESNNLDNKPPHARNWYPVKDPDLKKYLMNVIDSLLNHLATGSENKIFSVIPETRSEAQAAWEAGSKQSLPNTEWLAQPVKSPESVLIKKEEFELKDRALDMLEKECIDDPVATRLLKAYREGYSKASEIADVTGIPIEDVYKATKRLDRKVACIRKQLLKN